MDRHPVTLTTTTSEPIGRTLLPSVIDVEPMNPCTEQVPFWERRSTKVLLSLFDQALVSGTRFFTTVAVGRFCGAHDLGVYSLVFGVLLLVIGVQEALVSVPFTVHRQRRSAAELPAYLGSVVGHSLLLSILAAALLVPIAWAFTFSTSLGELSNVLWVLGAVLPSVLLRELAPRRPVDAVHGPRRLH